VIILTLKDFVQKKEVMDITGPGNRAWGVAAPRWQKSAEWELRTHREQGYLKPVSEAPSGTWVLTVVQGSSELSVARVESRGRSSRQDRKRTGKTGARNSEIAAGRQQFVSYQGTPSCAEGAAG
jgi:hypothetical protein